MTTQCLSIYYDVYVFFLLKKSTLNFKELKINYLWHVIKGNSLIMAIDIQM